MAEKFKIRLKIQGFELELEGNRDDVGSIGAAVGSQVSALLQPGAMVIDEGNYSQVEPQQPGNGAKLVTSKQKRRRAPSPSGGGDGGGALELHHDASKFGQPMQTWKTAQKSLWLLEVLHQLGLGSAHSARVLVETFNRHFKQAGTVTTTNTTRDLGRLKASEKPSPVGEDTNKAPSEWFLTDEGRRGPEF